MSDQKLVDLALLMERDPKAIGESIKAALKELREGPTPVSDGGTCPIDYFFKEIVIIVMDWIGRGMLEELSDLLGYMNLAMNAESDEKHVVYSLSPNTQLTVGLQSIAQVLAIFLRSDNVARLYAIISRPKNFECKRTLRWVFHYNRPVRAKDAYWMHPTHAGRVLSKLARLGLLEKYRSSGAFYYEMTYLGRGIGGVLNEANEVEYDIPYE